MRGTLARCPAAPVLPARSKLNPVSLTRSTSMNASAWIPLSVAVALAVTGIATHAETPMPPITVAVYTDYV